MKHSVSDAELDAMLTDWGSTARSVAGHQPMPELTSRTHRFRRSRQPRPARHQGWQVAAGAVAVALAAAIVVGLPKLLDQDRRASDPLPGVPGIASAPLGSKVVTFHGLSITVPASWPVIAGESCTRTSSVVELPNEFSTACFPLRPYPQFTTVRFLEGIDPLPKGSVTRTTRTTIGGLAAIRVEADRPAPPVTDRPAFGYVVAKLHASVLIEPAQGQTGRDLADSLRVDAVDSHGCRSLVADVNALPRSATSDRTGMAEALVPGRPASASVCRYVAGWLEEGATLSGSEALYLRRHAERAAGRPQPGERSGGTHPLPQAGQPRLRGLPGLRRQRGVPDRDPLSGRFAGSPRRQDEPVWRTGNLQRCPGRPADRRSERSAVAHGRRERRHARKDRAGAVTGRPPEPRSWTGGEACSDPGIRNPITGAAGRRGRARGIVL